MKTMDLNDYNDILPINDLNSLAESGSKAYADALPFPHAVFDDVFNPEILDKILQEFAVADDKWREFDTKYEKKFQQNGEELLGPVTRALIHNLNSGLFLRFLETLTGIKGLVADPYLVGGGLHKIPRGGKLGIHVDFNKHKEINAYRRINVLVYLNKDWDESFGGHFELWGDRKGGNVKKILPIFNRMAIFSTTSKSFHGHPEPLMCPEGRCRQSLALYYYTFSESGDQKKSRHSTNFVDKSGKMEELGDKSFFTKAKRGVKSILGLRSSNDS